MSKASKPSHHHASPKKTSGVSTRRRRMTDAEFNPEEGTIRFFLQGRPVVLYPSTAELENYNINEDHPPPSSKLSLEWVHGFRGKDCRDNVFILPSGEVLYFVAAVAVIYDVDSRKQRFYKEHKDDIKSMALHPTKTIVATGQIASHSSKMSEPHILVWDTETLETYCVLGADGQFERSVACIAFSKADGGDLIAAVDEGNDHTVSVWDWHKKQKLASIKGSADVILSCKWHPTESRFVTCGKYNLSIWDFSGNALSKKSALFGDDKPRYVTCLLYTESGVLLSGDSNGNIIVWDGETYKIDNVIRGAHDGNIFSLCVVQDGGEEKSIISGGGKDGKIKEWALSSWEPTGNETMVPDEFGPVRVIGEGSGSPKLFVGTTKNVLLQGGWSESFSPLTEGFTDEVWALAVHPTKPEFLSGAHDKVIRYFDAAERRCVWSKELEEGAQSACFSPDGSVIVVGLVSGKWIVLDASSQEILFSQVNGKEPIQETRFSPNGMYVAFGSRNNSIYVYKTSDGFKQYERVGKCQGHSSFVTHIDWSVDEAYIRSNSGDYEALFWNAAECKQETQSADFRDIEWATQTCVLTANSLGIWGKGQDGTDINAAARSNSKALLVTGDDFARVNAYAYPANTTECMFDSYSGHSSHVTDVWFLAEDFRLVSIGGRDGTAMQWSVE